MNATDSIVSYKSSDESIATVKSTGEVKGIAKGNEIVNYKNEFYTDIGIETDDSKGLFVVVVVGSVGILIVVGAYIGVRKKYWFW